MKKQTLWSALVLFMGFFWNAQGQTFTEIYVHRTNTDVEKVKIETDSNMLVVSIDYQGKQDKSFVKLNILKKDEENTRVITQRSDNKEVLTFTDFWLMGGAMILSDGTAKEFGREVYCFAPNGEMIITSGGPIFFPFHYAVSEQATTTSISIPQEQINNSQTLPSGEVYYVVSIPKKTGKYKLILMNYKENDTHTRIKLMDSKGQSTIFTSK